MKFIPSGDRVLVEVLNESVGGIILPDDLCREDLPQRKGRVVALPKSDVVTSELKVGETIFFENIGIDIKLDGKSYRLIHISYIMYVIN